MKYSVAQPDLTEVERKYLLEAFDSGWISSKGPFVQRFEQAFADYVGVKYAVACSSGTTALQLALEALRIGKDDEVIIPEFTMIATAYAVKYAGAIPVFVDCGKDLNIDIEKIEEKITQKTKAIIPVHIYGRPCNMEAIRKIAHDYNLFVIEDACEAHGASVDFRKVGSFGDVGCFSLFANKIIQSGEGGVCVTNDRRTYEQLQHLRSMSFDEEHSFWHPKMAHNFRITALQAAVALGQLERIEELIAKRKQIAEWYREKLGKWELSRSDGSVVWYYDIVFDLTIAEKIHLGLEEKGIENRLFFKPMSMQPCLGPVTGKHTGLKAFDFSRKGIYLPTHSGLTKEDVNWIADQVIDVYRNVLNFN